MNRLSVRLSLAFLVVTLLAIGAVALIVRDSTARTFRQYLNQSDDTFSNEETLLRLEEHYAETGSWVGADVLLPGSQNSSGQGSSSGQGRGQQGRGGAVLILTDADGVVVASTDAERIGSRLDDETRKQGIPLTVDDQRVGWLVQETPGSQALDSTEQDFLDESTRWIIVAAIVAGVAAIVIGVALSWQLTRPLRALTHAAHDLAGGALGKQVETHGTTEITELATAFNTMSHDLAEGEALRRRMAADIAHELRTPVTVLRAHLEAMLDGVFPLDAERLAVAYDRTIHLSRLVDDLRLLTRAEAGQLPLERVTVAPADLVARAVESFSPLALDAGITLRHTIAPDLPSVQGDVDRLQQILGNLLTNALRHTPNAGEINISVTQGADHTVRFAVANTGRTLTPQQAEHVFSPFWRAEDARERDKGGSGLGLAITRQLLRLHGGRIWVETAPNRTMFVFNLPSTSTTTP
ncbi:MAG: HAMP domain-containing protein [Anaerolineae bacterium]|nr:HAMP domain-containing protein [Anaerolineae bacterium]